MTDPRSGSNAASGEAGDELEADTSVAPKGAAPTPPAEHPIDEQVPLSDDPSVAIAVNASDAAADGAPSGTGRRIGAWVMLVAGILILGGTAWVGWRTYQAYSHLKNASAAVSELQDQLKDVSAIDPAAAAAVAHLQSESANARAAVDD